MSFLLGTSPLCGNRAVSPFGIGNEGGLSENSDLRSVEKLVRTASLVRYLRKFLQDGRNARVVQKATKFLDRSIFVLQGIPLTNRALVVSLIGAIRTSADLTVTCVLDESKYETGIKISDETFSNINIAHADFHGEWNYTISTNL